MSPTLKTTFAALILSAALAPTALAQPSGEYASASFTLEDLDMSVPADADILLKRIQSAANTVCERVVPQSPLAPRELTMCRKETVRSVVRDLAISTLTAALSGEPGMKLASR